MSLSVGIVGLPNVGKSTLFNALLQKQAAFAANFPFATVEPNIGVVPVPDHRLSVLAKIVMSENIVPATVKFVDIAGLVKGASEGEGLGNQFLSHIREVSVIVHVLRVFHDEDVVQTGSGDYVEDFVTVETELQLADLATLEKQKEPKGKFERVDTLRWEAVKKLKTALEDGLSARTVVLTDEEREASADLFLLTAKPMLVVLNVDEAELTGEAELSEVAVRRFAEKGIKITSSQIMAISARLEEELASFSPEERDDYLTEAGLSLTGLERLIDKAYGTLGLMSFLTAGEKEVRAWTIQFGMTAQEAAGVIHTDFAKHFISAKLVKYDDFVESEGWKKASEAGKVRTEGRGYIMQEGDVVEFMVSR